MTAQVAADLRAAADVLRRDGWTKGLFTDDDGCHCAAGALGVSVAADVEDAVFSERWRGVMDAFCRYLGKEEWPTEVYRWNDSQESADEVIAALEAAADAADRSAAYDEGRWCGECVYGVVMDPPCCTQGPTS